jgi:1,4-dihydroxy-2-naphthoyl-CoA hydrolase
MPLPPFRVPPEQTFDALYGMRRLEMTEESARGEVVVRPELLQPWGLVHGGVYASMAESLASWTTALAVADAGSIVMGMSNNTSFMRPIGEGTIHGLATRRHRGRTTWVWDVDITDDEGRLCASSRVTVAVRPYQPESEATQPR